MLARAGYGSRRRCEELIEQGARPCGRRGRPARTPRGPRSGTHVTVDGAPAPTAPGLVYYLLNKPAGVVTTADDPQGRADGARARPRRAARLPRRPPRPRYRGAPDPHQRRRPLAPAQPPLARGREGVPRPGARRPVPPGRPPAARRRPPRRRDHGPRAREPGRAGPPARRDPRGPQPPGPPDVQRRRPRGHPPRAHEDRPPRRLDARAGRLSRAHQRRGPPARRGRRRRGESSDGAGARGGAVGAFGTLARVPQAVRALRGATTVDADTAEQVGARTIELLEALLERNGVANDDLISVLLHRDARRPRRCSPPTAARTLGLGTVPAPVRDRDRRPGRHAAGASASSPTCTPTVPATSCTTSTSTARASCAMTSPTERALRAHVVGLGLVGGSVALGLRDAGWTRHRRGPRRGDRARRARGGRRRGDPARRRRRRSPWSPCRPRTSSRCCARRSQRGVPSWSSRTWPA